MAGLRLTTISDRQKVGTLMTRTLNRNCRSSGIKPLYCANVKK